ncbi:anti-sigma factor [uncultured Agrococcus sp.]|uniref:anti-sigma factor n=1 Tax=uncultured Agrococcus sp. TaxID=382258 RepID=UPI0025DCA8E9|nr:anti-sigma factor [uncultured Agrococcus sp.]
MHEHDFRELSAGHALGALSEEEERELHAALEEHPEWQSILDEDANAAASLALTAPAQEPPKDIRAGILAAINEQPQAVSQKRPRRLRMSLFALAASVVLILAIVIAPLLFDAARDTPPADLAMEEITAAEDARSATADVDGGGSVTLHWSISVGSAVIETAELPEIADDQAYELWFVRGETPISAGLIELGEDSELTLLAGEPSQGDIVAITVEEPGGSPTGEPTSDPIVAVETD